ncbi:MAG: ABC transporter permease [Desulfobacterales bacterium]|jgi:phospholipid/cholesterol/gamma-HCH transport system permease protein
MIRRRLAATGRWVIGAGRSTALLAGTWAAVVIQSLRPISWRRTVRRELMRHCYETGILALPFTLLVGALVGLGIVFQALYWLDLFGQEQRIGTLLVLVVGQEIAPILVGLILLGRSGQVMTVDLCTARSNGQVEMLDAQGVDPLLYLVLPRVVATALSSFCLAIAFMIAAMGVGFVLSNAMDASTLGLYDFINLLLMAMGPLEFAVIPLKTITIGFTLALICCMTGLSSTGGPKSVKTAMAGAYTRSVVAILMISGLLTLFL